MGQPKNGHGADHINGEDNNHLGKRLIWGRNSLRTQVWNQATIQRSTMVRDRMARTMPVGARELPMSYHCNTVENLLVEADKWDLYQRVFARVATVLLQLYTRKTP